MKTKHFIDPEIEAARIERQRAARKANNTPPSVDQLAALAEGWGAKLKQERPRRG